MHIACSNAPEWKTEPLFPIIYVIVIYVKHFIDTSKKSMSEQSALRQNGDAKTTENATEESGNCRGFALNVDLSACVGLPAYFRVWVRYETHNHARSMRWLGEHVCRTANIRGPFLMLVDKYLLPPNETLSLLRNSDSIRLARVENEWQRPFSYNNEPDYDPPSPPDEPVIVNNTRKPLIEPQPSPQQNSSSPQHTLSESTIEQSTFKTFPVSTPESQPSLVDENLQRVKRRALALLHQVTGEEQEQKGQDDVDAPKKRRRRVRRRRPARPISPFVEPTEPMSVSIESPASKSNVKALSLPDVRSIPDASLSPKSDIEFQPYPTPDSIIPPSIPDSSPQVTSLALGIPSVCQTSEPLASPSPASQSSRAARSSTPTVLLAVKAAPAPVLRNQASPRAPRVVRALSAGQTFLTPDDGMTIKTNDSFLEINFL